MIRLAHNHAGPEKEEVILVLFDPEGHPFSTTVRKPLENGRTRHTSYDFCYSKRDRTCYYDWSGTEYPDENKVLEISAPPNHAPWIAPSLRGFVVPEVTALEECPAAYPLEHLFLKFEEKATVYCARCDDFLPSDEPCAHISWCTKCGYNAYLDAPCPEHTLTDYGTPRKEWDGVPVKDDPDETWENNEEWEDDAEEEWDDEDTDQEDLDNGDDPDLKTPMPSDTSGK